MKCVNRSSKDFKFLAQHYDVSPELLEVITHKYWLETSTEDYFPSGVYIQKQLGKGRYEEPSKAVRDLWEKSYSKPLTFESREAFNAAYEKANKFFPANAVYFYKNNKDNYVLTVKKPVEKANDSIKDLVDKKSYDAQELADYNLVTTGNYRTPIQFAVEKASTPIQPWERDVNKEVLEHMDNMLLPVRYRDAWEDYFKRFPNSFVQQAIEYREMQKIKKQTLADGTFMKAPNGKNTNLTERQWLQVRTKNFINWFGNWVNDPANASKVVDENGEPLVVYHGSPEHGFTVFSKNSPDRFGRTTQGLDKKFYFTKDRITSRQFALTDEELRTLSFTDPEEGDYPDIEIHNDELDNRVYPVFLNIRKPVQINAEGKAIYQLSDSERREIDNSEGAIIQNALEQLPPRILELMPEADTYLSHPFTTDYLVSNPNQIKSATDNNGMFSTENDDIQMAVGKIPYNSQLDFVKGVRKPESVAALSSVIMSQANTHYKLTSKLAEEGERTVKKIIPFGDYVYLWSTENGYEFLIEKARAINSRNYDELSEDIETYGIDESTDRIIRDIQALGDRKERERRFIDTLKQAGAKTLSKEGRTSNGQQQLDSTNRAGIDGDTVANPKGKGLEDTFITPEGEIYGFVGVDGNIYLDEEAMHPEHPIHEYTHLWDRVLAKKNKKLWRQGIALMKQTSLWEKYANDENYGLKWKADKKIDQEQFDSLVASEVHARLVGKEGSRLLEEEAKKRGAKGIIARLREWLLEAYKVLKATFSDWTEEEISKLTLDDFVNMTVRDFFDGVNFREKNGKQLFTFRDGVTVEAPFSPNFQQVDALNFMSDFIKSKETAMTLSGYAGTGKTSLMEMIAKKMKKQGIPVVFSASTNQAAKVLSDRVSKAGFEAKTFYKVFGVNVSVDAEKAYDERNTVESAMDANIPKGTVVIIDEASMIKENLYDIINQVAAKNNLKVIYVGDEAQLAPVGEEQTSIVFRNDNGNMRRLTIVERTGDNAILNEATKLRNGEALTKESTFNKEGQGVAYVPQSNKAELRKIVEQFVPELRKNPNYFRILAFRNNVVTTYNEAVRAALGYMDETPRVNEPIVGYNNWGEDYNELTGEKTYKFINSGAYTVREVKEKETITCPQPLEDGTHVSLEATPIIIEDPFGKTQEVNLIDIKHNEANRNAALKLAYEKDRLAKEASRAWKTRNGQYKAIKDQMRRIEKFLFVNDEIAIPDKSSKDGKRVIQKKVFDYGYAMTVHKSQGSTFTHVMMDNVDISTASVQSKNKKEFDKNFAEEDLNIFDEVDPTKLEDYYGEGIEDDMDIFGEEDTPAPKQQAPKVESKDDNFRRQLRYVAVSRATDTVTIIDNNIKKEDSPLNHMHVEKAPAATKPKVKGENISSNGSEFAQQLTNPKNKVDVLYKGVRFDNAEHAYQTWKSGKFDQKGFNAHGGKIRGTTDYSSNYQTMVDIITAKLQQHPELVQGINERGGMEYLNASTHNVFGDDYWETSGQNKFMEALKEAYQNAINSENTRSIDGGKQTVTAAPYFRQRLSSSNKEYLETATQLARERAKGIANMVGVEIVEVETIGGTYNGDSEITYQYRISSEDQEKVDLFAALMADHGFEYQDAVIAANYVSEADWHKLPDNNKAIELIYSVPEGTAIEQIEETLEKCGIQGSTYHYSNGELAITAFSQEELAKFITELNSKTDYEYKGDTEQNSRYLDNAARQEIYRKELARGLQHGQISGRAGDQTQQNSQNRQYRNALQKALAICEAAAKFPDVEDREHHKKEQKEREDERIKAAKQAAEDWDAENRPRNYSEYFQPLRTDLVETADVEKAWRSDPAKVNPSRRFYLKGQRERGYFELVKDEEDNNYSVHFKPADSKNPNAFNQEEKAILFQALADTLPEGAVLSTWGELSKGGIAGLNRFAHLGFIKVGERSVKMKGSEETVTIPVLAKSLKRELTADILFNSPEARVAESKLLNKQGILDVNNQTQEGFFVGIKVKGTDKLTGIITWNTRKNKWDITVQPATGVNPNTLTPEENSKTQVHFSDEDIQKVVDKFLSKDLQEYFTSGQQKRDEAALYDFFNMLEKEGVQSLSERVRIYNNTMRGVGIGTNVLRDNWGIYTFNNSTEEVNLLDKEDSTMSPSTKLNQKLDEALPSEMKISLPGYAERKGTSEDITVDAEWKVEELKKLDAKFSTENSKQQNEDILFKMDKLLDAIDEEDYYGSLSKTQTATLEKKLGTLGEINRQIRRVQKSNRLPNSEINHVAELAINAISDYVTEIQKNPDLVKELFPMVKTELDFKTATRKQIIETITLNRLVEKARELFNSEEVDFDPSTALQADLIYDNFSGILQFGINIFAMNEGFGIKKNYKEDSYEITEGMHLDSDDFNRPQDTEVIEELEGDEQEHWQIEQRTLQILNTASEIVRMAFHGCYLVDESGNPVVSKWGIKERIDPHVAVYSVLAWTRGAMDLPTMISKLSAKQKSHRWLQQLMQRLQDTTGKEADFQSQFFNAMCKSRQRYSITRMKNGKLMVQAVNENPSLRTIMDNITTQFNMGEHPLFEKNGKIVSKYLGNSSTKLSEEFNLHKAQYELNQIVNDIAKTGELTDELLTKAQDNILGVCRTFGFNPVEEVVKEALNKDTIKYMTEKLDYLVSNLNSAYSKQQSNPNAQYKPFEFKSENEIKGTLRNFIEPITTIMDEVVPNMVYEDGKLYQQYVTPSYMSMLIEKMHWDKDNVEAFMDKAYGESEFFKSKKHGWRGGWVSMLRNDPKSREIIGHTVELNFNKKRYMRTMTPEEYTLSVFSNYFAKSEDEKSSMVPAWYRVPIQSNKPSNEYIRFWSYRGDGYKDSIIHGGYTAKTLGKIKPGGIYSIFLQELDRIDTVKKRGLKKGDAGFIKNFDTLGRKFCYLPFLNDYLDKPNGGKIFQDADRNKELARVLQKKVKAEEALSAEEEAALITMVQDAIRVNLEEKAQSILEDWEKNGIIKAAAAIDGIGSTEEEIRAALENFIWNDHYAALNILEMTIGDIACYKDAEDLQKRLAQLHAPGIRANIHATDYNGKRVSDGIYRTMVLKDFDSFVTNIVANLNEIFDRKIANAPDTAAREYWKALKHRLTRPRTYNANGSVKDQGGDYWNINVADAQGFSSPSSYRKKALMFGRWSEKAEGIYQKLKKGEYRFDDLDVAFQPLKPFVYAQLQKNMGVENAPIHTMPIPFQAKNAEYLLIMADALMQSEETSRPNLLRAVYNIMEESEEMFPTKGIDTVQFESSIKSGLHTPINLNDWLDVNGGEQAAYAYMHKLMYNTDAEGNLTYNTDTCVYEAPYENYCLQQEVPAHFKNHSQAQGSQERMIIPSDLEFADQEKAQRYRSEIENLTAENINLSIQEFREELKLDVPDKRVRNLALSEMLQREILDSSRYGIDMFLACGINEETGDFTLPKGDPIVSKMIEQLENSLIKKKINKQEIAGGPIVQVSNWGSSKQLHIRFNARSGGLLQLEEEFTPSEKYKTYKEYVAAEQAGIAHFEVFAPIWMKEIFEKFSDKDGIIDIGAIELFAPEILKMISYRIPTEDKYSIAPMKVAGFLPKEAGDGIMFPYELTGIDDSDFDVDKRYCMLWDYKIASRIEPKAGEDASEAEKDYVEHNRKSIIKELIEAAKLDIQPTKMERQEIEKEENAEAERKRKTAERIHKEALDRINQRNAMAEDAIDNTEFSKNAEKNEEIYDKKVDKLERSLEKALAKEEEKYQIKLAEIEEERQNRISKGISKLAQKLTRARVEQFLDVERRQNSKEDDAIARELRKAYLNYMYKLVPNPDKRAQNNNKILDLTWDVLTDESMAHQLLNPGGFEDWKRASYTIAAFKANRDVSWEELQQMDNSDMAKMFKKGNDLTFIDSQIQFYKQNAAAASLLGIFAVSKIAHATLESDNILIDVKDFCDIDEWKPIRIAGYTFGGFRDENGKALMSEQEFRVAKATEPEVYEDITYADYIKLNADSRFTNRMFIDPRYDKNGKLIGKTLGSGVGASADAAKDPFLDLINVNLSTINVLNTMVRLGMPFEDAALFLSQDVISDILGSFSRENLSGWASLDSIIQTRLSEIEKREGITSTSQIFGEEITKEQLIRNLRLRDDSTDYKVLKNFQRLQSLAEGMRNPSFATRFNSVSSAVGPLIIDNLILEGKRDAFRLSKMKNPSTGFYTVDGTPVDIDWIFSRHPILKAFAQTLDIAEQLFRDMPAGSTGFRNLINQLPKSLKRKLFSNKDLFNDLSNFYQSHMLVRSGMVNPESTLEHEEGELKYYIEKFPKDFKAGKWDEKYPDNPFLKNISYTTSGKTGRSFLNVNVVGESQPKKDTFSSGLIDLYKEEPKLALDLFKYFFYRGGINFTPKTAMGLFSTYIKEDLHAKDTKGKDVYYTDVYRKMESSAPSLIVDQFMRNNWNEGRLVPKKQGKFKIDYDKGVPIRLTAYLQEDLAALSDVTYMRTVIDKKTYLWRLVGNESDKENSDHKVFEAVKPLGDNNEYLEMSAQEIVNPMSETLLDIEDTEASDLQREGSDNPDTMVQEPKVTPEELAMTMQDFINGIIQWSQNTSSPYSQATAEKINEAIKAKPETFSKLIQSVLNTLGVHTDEKGAVEFYKKLC